MSSLNAPNEILILTDGKMGDLVQCRGIAQFISSQDHITEIKLETGVFSSLLLPWGFIPTALKVGNPNSPFAFPYPDMVIASGRRMVPYLRAFHKTRNNNKKPFTVFLKDPRAHHNEIDFIWAPTHDKLTRNNVFQTLTSPHTLSQENLSCARTKAAKRFKKNHSPTVGIILGGNSKSVTWTSEIIKEFCQQLSHIQNNSAILITASRRTPQTLLTEVKKTFENHNTWVWNGEGENPYAEILAYSDRLIITGDSHNMVSEALAAGKPVHVFRPPGLHKKLTQFLNSLEEQGLTNDMTKGFQRTTTNSLDATGEIAAEILRRFNNPSP